MNIGGVWAKPDAADVDQMAGTGKQRDHAPLVKGRRRQHKIIEVSGAHPRVVGDVYIAWFHRISGKVAQEMLH